MSGWNRPGKSCGRVSPCCAAPAAVVVARRDALANTRRDMFMFRRPPVVVVRRTRLVLCDVPPGATGCRRNSATGVFGLASGTRRPARGADGGRQLRRELVAWFDPFRTLGRALQDDQSWPKEAGRFATAGAIKRTIVTGLSLRRVKAPEAHSHMAGRRILHSAAAGTSQPRLVLRFRRGPHP